MLEPSRTDDTETSRPTSRKGEDTVILPRPDVGAPATDEQLAGGGHALAAEAALARKAAIERKATAGSLRAQAGEIQAQTRAHAALLRARADDSGRPRTGPRPQHGDGPVAFILVEDHELAQHLPERQRRQATATLRAPVVHAAPGSWNPPHLDPADAYGLLLLDGLAARRVHVADTAAMEILGPGDILRPGAEPALADSVALQTHWQILQPARVAMLGKQVTSSIARWPELSVAISGRLLRRTQRLTYLLAVSHLSRIEDRLLAMLWYLGASWGRVTPQGVTVPIGLTHQMLGDIAGARRPSVSIAMASLRDRGVITRQEDGLYVLCGDPPAWQQPVFNHLGATDGAGSRSGGALKVGMD